MLHLKSKLIENILEHIPFYSPKTDQASGWDNYANNQFYEVVKAEGLAKLAVKGGLSNACDLKLLTPYWTKAKSILEVGAGYGRVLDFLLKNDYQGKLTAIERSQEMHSHLQKKYPTVNLLKQDIHDLSNIREKFDLILWLWSGIADFSPPEQFSVLSQLTALLSEKGMLIFEALPDKVQPLNTQKGADNDYLLKVDQGVIHLFDISNETIDSYGEILGYSRIEHLEYTTDTGRRRVLHLLFR